MFLYIADVISPTRKQIKCVDPEILGMMYPMINMANMYVMLIFVGTDDRLMPSMTNIIPESPTMGIEERTIKEATTDNRYAERRVFIVKRFLSTQNQMA